MKANRKVMNAGKMKEVQPVWDDELQKWFFSIVDNREVQTGV